MKLRDHLGMCVIPGLKGEGLEVFPLGLDVTNGAEIDEAKLWTEKRFGRLDVLVNNAAILYDSWQRAVSADLRVVREAFETNTLGPWRMCEAFLPLLRRSRHARIVNVSSEFVSVLDGAARVVKVANITVTKMKVANNETTRTTILFIVISCLSSYSPSLPLTASLRDFSNSFSVVG